MIRVAVIGQPELESLAVHSQLRLFLLVLFPGRLFNPRLGQHLLLMPLYVRLSLVMGHRPLPHLGRLPDRGSLAALPLLPPVQCGSSLLADVRLPTQ